MNVSVRPQCTICKGYNVYRLYEKFSLQIFRCRYCDVVFTFPMPKQDDTLARYSKDWFEQEYLPSYGIVPNQPSVAHLESRYHAELEPLERFRKCGRLLDVGAGAGLFLNSAREHHWDVMGVELSSYGPAYAKRHFDLDIIHGTLYDATFPSNYFDVVMLQDTIEHVTDPYELLQEAHRILRPGGAVVISTPNFDSVSRRLFGSAWALVSPAEHVHLFSMRSLLWLSKATGFAPFRLESDTRINPDLFHGRQSAAIKIKRRILQKAAISFFQSILYKFSLGDEIYSIMVSLS